MDFALFSKVVDEISSFRPLPSVGLNYGGESLLHPRFADALALLAQRGLCSRTGFNTNAAVLRPEVADLLVEVGIRSVSISLDGFKTSHERIRVGSRYDKVVENTMSLVEARRRRGAVRPQIVVNLTRVDQDESEIQAFVDHWAVLVDEVRVWLKLLQNPLSQLHGFDSFEGLPEDWNPRYRRGHFSTGGAVPVLDDPRVNFFKGRFEDVLPTYCPPEHDRLVVLLDADLYSSTQYVLRSLERHIVPGTYLYFDEFRDRHHEMKAFTEFEQETRMQFEVIGESLCWLYAAFRRVR